MGGLAADLSSLGLSFGSGAILGAILGGLGLGGLAWAFDQLGGDSEPRVVWSEPFLERLARDALLRYLAVAHFGRGAGEYRERLEPASWHPVADALLERHRKVLRASLAAARLDSREPGEGEGLSAGLTAQVDGILREALITLYPGTERLLREG